MASEFERGMHRMLLHVVATTDRRARKCRRALLLNFALAGSFQREDAITLLDVVG
jgi:hypothetical protein